MKIATWNVNSIRIRLPRLLAWLSRVEPDVLCLQETKVVDDDFPYLDLRSIGYHCLINGQKTYNGVAILSREEGVGPVRDLPGDGPDDGRRVVSATLNGIRVIGVYAPNGGDVGTDRYSYKLDWYKRLRAYIDSAYKQDTDLLICGDFNVAPEDRDVWDPEKFRGKILFSEPEKEALKNLMAWGLTDALRMHHQEAGIYTWWDYRAGAFHRGWGMRIDHVLISSSLERRCTGVEVDRNERKGEKPSDHAPVIAYFD
ncbi:MAG TPA: exodeoxyribonuclease III [Blastocatellia bacterium]|nr:exodeoxyribonuclease III [Blastocatellia bacterium]